MLLFFVVVSTYVGQLDGDVSVCVVVWGCVMSSCSCSYGRGSFIVLVVVLFSFGVWL